MDVSKNRGTPTVNMDGENNGKPYEQMDDLGGFPIIFASTPMWLTSIFIFQHGQGEI